MSQLLYQLSYAGAPVVVFAESSAACRRSHGRPRALLSNCCQNRRRTWGRAGLARDLFQGRHLGAQLILRKIFWAAHLHLDLPVDGSLPQRRTSLLFSCLVIATALPFGLIDQIYAEFGLPHPRPDELVREKDAKILSGLPILFGTYQSMFSAR